MLYIKLILPKDIISSIPINMNQYDLLVLYLSPPLQNIHFKSIRTRLSINILYIYIYFGNH